VEAKRAEKREIEGVRAEKARLKEERRAHSAAIAKAKFRGQFDMD